VRLAAAATSLAELHVRLGAPDAALAAGAVALWRALAAALAAAPAAAGPVAQCRAWTGEAAAWAERVAAAGRGQEEQEAAGILAALREMF
jgi:hypothetical protein